MLHHTTVEPVRLRSWDVHLSCEVLRIVGYRMECTCGDKGKVHATVSAARGDLREHRADFGVP